MRESGLTIYAGSIRANFRALWSGTWSTGDFIIAMLETIALGLRTAWIEGMESAGVAEDEISPEEWSILQERINQENAQIAGLAADINASNRAAGGKLGDLMPRAELWINRYNDIVNLARMTASTDPKLRWAIGVGAIDHCQDCLDYNGKVYRASVWAKYGIRPQGENLACGGWRCQCEFVPAAGERGSSGHPRAPSGGG
jgi:hypothetical protein